MNQSRNSKVYENIEKVLNSFPVSHFLNCHNIKSKLISKFLYFRLKTFEPKKIHKNKYDSRSMAL